MQMVAGVLVSMFKAYAIKLASQEFLEWVLFQIVDAIVKSTKTPHDDKLVEKIKEVLDQD